MIKKYLNTRPRTKKLARSDKVDSVSIPSRAAIFNLFIRKKKPLTSENVSKFLHCDSAQSNALSRRLRAMLRDGQLASDASGRFSATKNSRVVKAKVVILKNRTLTFRSFDGSENLSNVILGHHQASSLMHGDEIRLRYFPGRVRSSHAMIVAIDHRAIQSFVGQLQKNDDGYSIVSTSPMTSASLQLADTQLTTYEDATFVKVDISAYPTDRSPCIVKVSDVLGTLDSPRIIQSVMIQAFNLKHQFSQEALAQADSIHAQGIIIDHDRVDWRSKSFVTIDGADAKDFDDAICIEPCDDGWRVFIAISDVSHYIKPGSCLDKEAYARATSVYLPNTVIPMLPFVLSDGLCSLCPDVDRLAKGLEMVLDRKGRVCRFTFSKAVIRSKRRLTYTYAQQVIDHKQSCDAWLKSLLFDAAALYEVLNANRVKRGALEIDLPFVHMQYDQHDKIETITKQSRLTAHKIIEELMLLANEVTAGYLLERQVPAVFRNHNPPDVSKLKGLIPFLSGRKIAFVPKHLDKPKPHDIADIIKQLCALDHGECLVPMMLSTLAQACYEPQNKGHFGLAYQHYCHFTSPIRRYPDLLVHRALDNLITHRHDPIFSLSSNLNTVAEHCSVAERIADDAQKRASQWLKCYFMLERVGQVFSATISMVKHFGFFVTIDDFMIDGMVHISTLDGFYTYDDQTLSLNSSTHSQSYVIGQVVRVRVSQVSVMNQSIDLTLIHEPQ